jgi:hypothetical protein
VEKGGEDSVELVEDYAQVEAIIIDDPLDDVFLVEHLQQSSRKIWMKQPTDHRTFAANLSSITIRFLQMMLYFPSTFFTKLGSLVARMLPLPKTNLIVVMNAFSWKLSE